MKKILPFLLILVIAAALTFIPWVWVIGYDQFHGAVIGENVHKVFSYGFPFTIVEGTTGYPHLTPEWQTPWRFTANFLFFVAAGLLTNYFIRKLVKRTIRPSLK